MVFSLFQVFYHGTEVNNVWKSSQTDPSVRYLYGYDAFHGRISYLSFLFTCYTKLNIYVLRLVKE